MLYTREFALRHPDIAANVVHPGTIATGLWRALPAPVRGILGTILPSPERGAVPIIRLASASDVDGVTGRYFDRLRDREPARAALDAVAGERLWTYAERTTALDVA